MTDTANLEDGFYWVRDGGKWEPAYWSGTYFYTPGNDMGYEAEIFLEIDPRPIKREDVK